MDVAAASIAMHQVSAKQQFGVGLAGKMKDQMEQQGEAFEKLLDTTGVSATDPSRGQSIDLKA